MGFALEKTHVKGEIREEAEKQFVFQVYEKEHRMDREPQGGYTRHNSIKKSSICRVENWRINT